MLERLVRFCVGVGFLWGALVVLVGLVLGLDMPGKLFQALDPLLGPAARATLYQGLSFVVVPVGLFAFLRDVLRDPGPLWLKAGAPGLVLAVGALFLAAAAPELGQPMLQAADRLAIMVAPGETLDNHPEAAASWLLRFVALAAGLGGFPAVLGMLAQVVGGLGAGRHRPR